MEIFTKQAVSEVVYMCIDLPLNLHFFLQDYEDVLFL